MLKRLSLISFTLMILIFPTYSHAGWLLYSKPEFRGRVIDKETRAPVEGAVVVVLYEKWEFGGPGGGNTLPMDAKETLTDQNGEFLFPAYRTLIGPLSRVSEVSFIIFKPGYKSITRIEGTNIPDEKYFSIKRDMIGRDGEIKYADHFGALIKWRGIMGIVDLQKGDRSATSPPGFRSDKLPLLYKAINEDRRNRGLEGEIK